MEVLELDDDLWEVGVHLLHENVDVGLRGRQLASLGEMNRRYLLLRRRRSFVVVADRRREDPQAASRCPFRDPARWEESEREKVSSTNRHCEERRTALGLIPPAAT